MTGNNRSQGYMRITTVIILTGIILLLVVTNPATEDFASWAIEKDNQDNSPLARAITSAVGEPFVRGMTDRNNYLLFSIFEYRETKTVGILGVFITIPAFGNPES
ncbi:MAG: hypothetical protein ACOCQB_01980 [Halanaerobiaceae bacterium]